MSNRFTRLPERQQRYLTVVLGGFVVLLLNSFFLLLFEYTTAALYMGMVLLHVLLGVILILPIGIFLVMHVGKMPLGMNRPAVLAGLFTALSVVTLIGTGILLIVWGSSAADGFFLRLHIGATVTSILGFVAHISFKKGVKFHFIEWGNLWKKRSRQVAYHPFFLIFLAGFIITGVYFVNALAYASPETFLSVDETGLSSPAEAALVHDGYLREDDLMRSQTCGQSGCHPNIYDQWEASAHHFSSFNNPYYRSTVELMIQEGEQEGVRWCASCHDSAVLFSGGFQDNRELVLDHPTAQAGITCLSCHAIQGLRDVKGNGRYVIGEPDEYPFARSEDGIARWLHNTLIQIKPEPHREAMLKPMHLTPEFCGTCHKVGIPPEVNDYRWLRGQNQYDSWQASGVSGSTIRSFYVPPAAQTCQSCHMKQVPSDDRGGEPGVVRSHRFAAANATIPAINGHQEQLDAVRETLADSVVTLDIFNVQVNGQDFGPEAAVPVLEAGDDVTLSVVVRNRGVGHRFPAGTNDSNELWIELAARNGDDRRVLSSGHLDENRMVDSTAHFFGAVLVDRHSQRINKRNIQDWVTTIYANTIDPGTAETVHYRYTVPAGITIESFEATLHYRKFKEEYNQWVFRKAGNVFEQPIQTVHSAVRRVGRAYGTPRPLWERWNDYGIGLFREGNTRMALDAFDHVSNFASESPEGPINKARVHIAEGQLDAALDALESAEEREPGFLKTAYFRGLASMADGLYGEALADWEPVAAVYPRDRVLLRNIGRVHYLLGDYEESLRWMDRVLVIDPEDLGALYNSMLAHGALGQTADFEHFRELYQYHQIDESARSMASEYRQRHEADNRESQPIHYHKLHEVAINER